MLNVLWAAFLTLAFVCGAVTGRLSEVSAALTEGAAGAVTLAIGIAGLMCFWSGIMELMQGDEITVGAVLLPEALKNCDDANYIKFIKIAQDCNIPVWHVKTGDFVGNSQVTVQCLHPEISYHTDSVNDISAVYRIDYGEFSMLMTGDAGMNVENELLEKGVLSPVTILKTGHHGSKSASSEAFLEEIRPQAALISCGVNNRYHHPSEEVIQRFKKMDIQTKVTAQCGQITVKSDGKTYRLMQWQ